MQLERRALGRFLLLRLVVARYGFVQVLVVSYQNVVGALLLAYCWITLVTGGGFGQRDATDVHLVVQGNVWSVSGSLEVKLVESVGQLEAVHDLRLVVEWICARLLVQAWQRSQLTLAARPSSPWVPPALQSRRYGRRLQELVGLLKARRRIGLRCQAGQEALRVCGSVSLRP